MVSHLALRGDGRPQGQYQKQSSQDLQVKSLLQYIEAHEIKDIVRTADDPYDWSSTQNDSKEYDITGRQINKREGEALLEEPQLNGRIAAVIRSVTRTSGWQVREELRGALRGPKTKPDVLITRTNGPPVVLETEYPPASTLAGDCLKSLGRELNPSVANAAGEVSSVIGIRATDELHQCDNGDEAQQMLEDGHEIEYAVYQGTAENHVRFPDTGFIRGSIRDLIDFVRPAAESQATIDAATEAFGQGVEDAAAVLLTAASEAGSALGERIGTELRQPWPAYPPKPPRTPSEIGQERADQTAREQTAKMAVAIIINAMAYQQNLAGFSAEVMVNGVKEIRTIDSLTDIRRPTGFHPDDVISAWESILDINYWPIFDIAIKLLRDIPPVVATNALLEKMTSTANSVQDAIQQSDVAGTVFQKLIADRQTLATYYTRPESTALAAYLAIPNDLDWGNPATLKDYYIADYACGTGGLALAAYQRVRELHRAHGGDPDAHHAHMMVNNLTACDIMPAAVHLTSSLLSSVAPRAQYAGTRNILYLFGATFALDRNGNRIHERNRKKQKRKYPNRDPVYRMDEVNIGSLELLNINTTRYQAAFPLNAEMAVGPRGSRAPIEVEMTPLSQSLVIMNPPFTTPTNHAADHAKPGNPAFAAFGTTTDEQNAMSAKVKRLSTNSIGDGNAGLGSHFAQIAHNMVRPGGHIALILPMSSMLGGSYDGRAEWSWQKLRRLLSDNYNDIIVVSIAQNEDIDSSFSADTNIAEAMIIARSMRHGEAPQRRAYFVNLAYRPQSKLSAQETARSIRRAVSELTRPDTTLDVTVGNEVVGTVRLEDAPRRKTWTTVRVADIGIIDRTKKLALGELHLPQRNVPVQVPIVRLGRIGRVGPLARDITEAGRGPFNRREGANSGTVWPMLWGSESAVQTKMRTEPDSAGSVKRNQNDAANLLWKRASNLHVNITMRFNSNPTIAAYTEKRTLGGRAWPNIQMDSTEFEKATCVWLNGTMGLISCWIEGNRIQSGRSTFSINTVRDILTLDVSSLGQDELESAARIYDDLCDKELLPANEAFRDPIRQEIDRRLMTEVLGLDNECVEQLAIIRNQWCREPTVIGTKSTGPDDI